MRKKFLEAGRLLRVHGIRGELRFEHWCDSPSVLDGIKEFFLKADGTSPLSVVSARTHGNVILYKFEGFDAPETARTLAGKVLYADRDLLKVPEGSVFISDLIGLDLTDDSTGEKIGTITDVVNRGSCDLYVVDMGGGRSEYFPAVKEFIVKKDLDREVRVKVPDGLF
ncbi:MAG: 16S rRNA processing protein RimM [Clostridia bacterium]|nr:16S rRNA processing protein RimM [Clostridia bacterium]